MLCCFPIAHAEINDCNRIMGIGRHGILSFESAESTHATSYQLRWIASRTCLARAVVSHRFFALLFIHLAHSECQLFSLHINVELENRFTSITHSSHFAHIKYQNALSSRRTLVSCLPEWCGARFVEAVKQVFSKSTPAATTGTKRIQPFLFTIQVEIAFLLFSCSRKHQMEREKKRSRIQR